MSIRPSILAALLTAASLNAPGAAPRESASPKRQVDTPGQKDYSAFKLIAERNIFNSARASRSSRAARSEDRKASHVDTITLVGTMAYEKGPFAFFEGSSSDFKKVLEPGKSIAGYKIAEINGNMVKLEAGTNQVTLNVGMQMRREEEGEWRVIGGSPTSSKPAETSASASSSADDEDLIVKRMMQQREQELK
jgi:hypothetical protein